MATHPAKTCFLIPLTFEQALFAITVIETAEYPALNYAKPSAKTNQLTVGSELFKLARKLVKSLGCDLESKISLGLRAECLPSEGLKISYNSKVGALNAATFAKLILKHFDLDCAVRVNATNVCESEVIGRLIGEAAFVTKSSIKWLRTSDWLDKQEMKHHKMIFSAQ